MYYTYDNFYVTKVKYIMYTVQIIELFIITMFVWLHVRVVILLTCGKHVQDRTTSLRGRFGAHTISLTPPLFIEVHAPRQDSAPSYICVLGASILPLSTILRLTFGTIPTVWWFCFILRFYDWLLELFRQYGDFASFYDFTIDFWNYSDSMVILLLSTILRLTFGTIPTVWWFCFFLRFYDWLLELFRQYGDFASFYDFTIDVW
jgi:hypothetical protein